MKRARRLLFLTHRWLGIGACLLALLWFGSGVVMMYVPYPSLTAAERWAGSAPIDWARVRVQPRAALRAAQVPGVPAQLRLEMQGDRPVWRIQRADRRRATVSAETGLPMPAVDATEATAIAARFARQRPTAIDRIERDQWTVAQGFDPARPLWRVRLGDAAGTELYVSARTGELVQQTNRWERGWNWVGAIPHWLYLTVLRQDGSVWRQLVMWTSGPATIMGITGLWIGILRFRPRRARVIPYRGWMRWHHLTGLVGGLTMITWMASGWLSVHPFGWFAQGGDPIVEDRYRSAGATFPPISLTTLAASAADAREVRFAHLGGRPVARLYGGVGGAALVDPQTGARLDLDSAQLLTLARRAMPGARIAGIAHLTAPDIYWYGHWSERPLPVWRVRFADAAGTWLYIDARTGELLSQSTSSGRVYRWLFNLVHDFDLPVLLAARWLRDPLMWLLLALGTAMSASGVVIGWRRLRHPRAPGGKRQDFAVRHDMMRGGKQPELATGGER